VKRWAYVQGDVKTRNWPSRCFLITDAKKQMKNAGWRPSEGAYRKFKVRGQEFDPAKPEEYVKSFAIHKLGRL
jgi:nitrate/nitrite transport system substrate-binding protein